jgi:hypothetical protein
MSTLTSTENSKRTQRSFLTPDRQFSDGYGGGGGSGSGVSMLKSKNNSGSTNSLNGQSASSNSSNSGSRYLNESNLKKTLTSSSHNVLVDMTDLNTNDAANDDEYDGLLYVDASSALQTMQMLNVLRKNRQLCDLILQLDNDSQDIYCHQIILACHSKFFMEIFNNYEIEQKNNYRSNGDRKSSSSDEAMASATATTMATSTTGSSANNNRTGSPLPSKKSLQMYLNKNHNSTRNQLVFCLSDYLRNYLSDNYHHHYAKMNSITNHNSPYHHHYNHNHRAANGHANGGGGLMVIAADVDDTIQQTMNHSMDYEALKICIEYMYTAQLRVPSHLLPHVYTLAYHLSFDGIVSACASYLSEHLNADNCLSVRSFALDESLIQASTQCIEKNIEYILQLTPPSVGTSSSSAAPPPPPPPLPSSQHSIQSTQANQNGDNFHGGVGVEHIDSQPSLSCSLNLANKEFNHLPRINVELVGLRAHNLKLPDNILSITQLCMSWLVDELVTTKRAGAGVGSNVNVSLVSHHTLDDLCNNLNMLYINGKDHTLHNCCDMNPSDANFSEYIHDYQLQHGSLFNTMASNSNEEQENFEKSSSGSRKGSSSDSRQSPPASASVASRLKTFKITDQELNAIGTATPIRLKVPHDNEVVCTHQTSESSFITICTLKGRLVTISVHLMNKSDAKELAQFECSNTNYIEDEQDTNSKAILSSLVSEMNAKEGAESHHSQQQQQQLMQQQLMQQQSQANSLYKRNLSSHNSIEVDKLPKMSVARCTHGCIAYNRKLYIVGGYERGECLNTCEVYDPIRNSIECMQPSMHEKRGRAAIVFYSKNSSIYVIGGSNGHEELNSIERFNMDCNEWTTIKFDFELACNNTSIASCLNYIYVVGLRSVSSKALSWSSCLRYDPIANVFERIADLNYGRSQSALVWYSDESINQNNVQQQQDESAALGVTASAHPGYLYVFGGHDHIRCVNSCEMYDIKGNKWTVLNSMHEPRRGCGAALHAASQSIYIVGGTNGSQSLKSVEIFNLKTKKWTPGPELNVPRANVAVAFIGNYLIKNRFIFSLFI